MERDGTNRKGMEQNGNERNGEEWKRTKRNGKKWKGDEKNVISGPSNRKFVYKIVHIKPRKK